MIIRQKPGVKQNYVNFIGKSCPPARSRRGVQPLILFHQAGSDCLRRIVLADFAGNLSAVVVADVVIHRLHRLGKVVDIVRLDHDAVVLVDKALRPAAAGGDDPAPHRTAPPDRRRRRSRTPRPARSNPPPAAAGRSPGGDAGRSARCGRSFQGQRSACAASLPPRPVRRWSKSPAGTRGRPVQRL